MTKIPTISDIKDAVCAEFAITRRELDSSDRRRMYARPRQVAMVLARERACASLMRIGNQFGRDHTTVLHAIRELPRHCAKEPDTAERLERLRSKVMHSALRDQLRHDIALARTLGIPPIAVLTDYASIGIGSVEP